MAKKQSRLGEGCGIISVQDPISHLKVVQVIIKKNVQGKHMPSNVALLYDPMEGFKVNFMLRYDLAKFCY